MSDQEDKHRMRISIDLSSIKDHSFKGNVYAHYSSCQYLGIKQQFRTTPALEIIKPVIEIQFSNSFASYTFDSTKEELFDIFESLTLEIEIFHSERNKKDSLIGKALIAVKELLKSPIRKTASSYVRVMDAYHPIDDEELNRIGLIRAIFYLEDLGPADQLQQQEQRAADQIGADPALPIIGGVEDKERKHVITELTSLEQKVIWELDTWKKSEEAKFKVQLRQKEYDLTQKLYGEFKQKEYERDKQFKQYFAQVQLNESKIKQKAQDLQRRENKILSLEEEVKQKLVETAKIVKQKDEEMGLHIKRQKDEKLQWEKDKTLLNLKLGDAQGQITKLEEELKQIKVEMKKSPISIIKGTLQEKQQELNEVKKDLERTNEIKETYKQYYEKIRDEMIKYKKNQEDYVPLALYKTSLEDKQQEINELRKQVQESNSRILMSSKPNVYQPEQFEQQQQQQQQQQQFKQQESSITKQQIDNPFKNALIKDDDKMELYRRSDKSQIKKQYPSNHTNDLQRLIQEREYLLESEEYTEDDPFIQEITNQIQLLGGE